VDLHFNDNEKSKFQPQREYLGLLVGSLLVKHISCIPLDSNSSSPVTFRWTTDCNGAKAWGEKHKCSSSSAFCTNAAITWLQLFANLFMAESLWIPGTKMQDIDRLSRRRVQHGPHSSYAPNMHIDKEVHLPLGPLLQLGDPYINRSSVNEFHESFTGIHNILSSLFPPIPLSI
jgi:hypothetical protein